MAGVKSQRQYPEFEKPLIEIQKRLDIQIEKDPESGDVKKLTIEKIRIGTVILTVTHQQLIVCQANIPK